LYRLLSPLTDGDFERKTQFKNWTIHDVVSHLHAWNWAAHLSLTDEAGFAKFRQMVIEEIGKGRRIVEVEKEWLDAKTDRDRLEQWREFFESMTPVFEGADPKRRVGWIGPDMSVRSSITARLMETWAHGQELYDALGVERRDEDRIKNIAVLGVNTFGWTFMNRGLPVPSDPPHVRLTSPAGQTWTWNDPSETNLVEGSATEFCQVVTQVRSFGDTRLHVVGDTATRWMAIAQCFAGPPEDPPAPGARHRVA
jgi:uncharacterized protein (TIGR03084 family)